MCSWVWPGVASVRSRQAAEVNLVPVLESLVRELPLAGTRRQHCRAVGGGKLDRAAEEVRVQVGIGGVGDPQPSAFRSGAQRPQVSAGVDRECPPVVQVHQVGRVSQPFVHNGDDVHEAATLQHSKDY